MILHHPRLADVTATVTAAEAPAWTSQGWVDLDSVPEADLDESIPETDPDLVEEDIPDLD